MASRYRVEHRHIKHREREFHFVSYEGQRANATRNEIGTDDAWFLVNDGYRLEAMPQELGQAPDETDRLLVEWIETQLLAPASPA